MLTRPSILTWFFELVLRMSVDEGDFAFEYPEKVSGNIPAFQQMSTDKTVKILGKEWKVTERGHAVCEGFRGELPEIIEEGETFDYVHLSGPQKELVTLEYFDEDEIYAYRGKWVDPFEITVEAEGFNACKPNLFMRANIVCTAGVCDG